MYDDLEAIGDGARIEHAGEGAFRDEAEGVGAPLLGGWWVGGERAPECSSR